MSARPANVHQDLAPFSTQPGAPFTVALLRAAADRRHVAADVRLGDADPDHELSACDLRKPGLFLLFRASGEERLREDLRPRDERPGSREGRRRQFFRRQDHREIAHLVAPVGFRDGKPEVPDLRHFPDQGLRDEIVVTVDVFGLGRDLSRGELPHARPDLLERLVDGKIAVTLLCTHLPPDLADEALAARAAHQRANVRGVRRFHVRLGEPEVIQERQQAIAGISC